REARRRAGPAQPHLQDVGEDEGVQREQGERHDDGPRQPEHRADVTGADVPADEGLDRREVADERLEGRQQGRHQAPPGARSARASTQTVCPRSPYPSPSGSRMLAFSPGYQRMGVQPASPATAVMRSTDVVTWRTFIQRAQTSSPAERTNTRRAWARSMVRQEKTIRPSGLTKRAASWR